jgi:hypothetical protein
MSGTAERVVGIRRRSRAEAERLVTEYESSGLTRALFCAGRGFSVGTLDYYRKCQRDRMRGEATRIVPVQLLSEISTPPVNPSEDGIALWVELRGGCRIAVGRGFDAHTLKRLVAALGAA